jgi:hypothetical protein
MAKNLWMVAFLALTASACTNGSPGLRATGEAPPEFAAVTSAPPATAPRLQTLPRPPAGAGQPALRSVALHTNWDAPPRHAPGPQFSALGGTPAQPVHRAAAPPAPRTPIAGGERAKRGFAP